MIGDLPIGGNARLARRTTLAPRRVSAVDLGVCSPPAVPVTTTFAPQEQRVTLTVLSSGRYREQHIERQPRRFRRHRWMMRRTRGQM